MSNDQPTSGQPPEDDPFSKKPPGSQPPPSSGSPYGSAPPPPPPHDPGPYGGGQYGGTDPLAGMPPLAEPGKRILARLIDFLIISIPLYLISLPWGGAVEMSDGGNDDDVSDVFAQTYSGHQLLWSLIALVVYVAYDTYFTHKDGRTLGKRLLKLRVAMLNDGRVPDTGSAFLRAVVLWVAGVAVLPVPVVADQHRVDVHGQAVQAGAPGQGGQDGGGGHQLTDGREGVGTLPAVAVSASASARPPAPTRRVRTGSCPVRGRGCGPRVRQRRGRCHGVRTPRHLSSPLSLCSCAPASGTVTATSRPSASAAVPMTAMPMPDSVRDSSSMARVEKTTVTEP